MINYGLSSNQAKPAGLLLPEDAAMQANDYSHLVMICLPGEFRILRPGETKMTYSWEKLSDWFAIYKSNKNREYVNKRKE
jgi:hypothetical protein